MPRATCSTGLPLPGSPHFKLNKAKQVKKPRQPSAATGCEQPWRFLFGSLSCYLLLPWYKSPVQGQTSPPDRWFCSSKESNQQFSKHTMSAFVSIWISQPKKNPIRAFTWVQVKPLQLQGGSACSGRAGISQLPAPHTCRSTRSREQNTHQNIKTPSLCGHVGVQQSHPTCSSSWHGEKEPQPCPGHCCHGRNRTRQFWAHLHPGVLPATGFWVRPANRKVTDPKMTRDPH